MAIAYRAVASANNTGTATLTIDMPAGTVDNDIMLALIVATDSDGIPSISAPAGWTEIASNTIGTSTRLSAFWKRASSEGASYEFTMSGTASGKYQNGCILSYSGCAVTGSPINAFSTVGYLTSNTTLRAGGVTTTYAGVMLVFLGGTYSAPGETATPPSGMSERFDSSPAGVVVHGYGADVTQAAAGASGDKDATLSGTNAVKHAFLIALVPNVAPGTPTLSSPEDLGHFTLGETIDLTASGTDANGDQLKYRWKYDSGGGDTTIGDTSLVDSGEEETYQWDTGGLPAGTYTLKCWAVDQTGLVSAAYDSVEIEIIFLVVTAPDDESSHLVGNVTLSGMGYLDGDGRLRLQWEVDTNNPPDSESEDYDLITSALVDQDTEVSVVANISHLGTWYVRPRTQDEEEATSEWSTVTTIYALEELRLLPGSKITRSILEAANKVYGVVDQSDPLIVVSATNDEGELAHSAFPLETGLVIPRGTNETGAQAIVDKQIVLRADEQVGFQDLALQLCDGVKLDRGMRVGIQLDRAGASATTVVRHLEFDIPTDTCMVTVGDWNVPKDKWDAFVALFQEFQSLKKERT